MKFEHTITVGAAYATVAAFFEDVPTVAACVPGVDDFQETGPDAYRGSLKVRLGPLGFTVAGDAQVSRDDDGAFRMTGEGHDRRIGAGAIAILQAHLAGVFKVFSFTSFRIICRPSREKISMSDAPGKMIEPIKITCCFNVIREIRSQVNITQFHKFFICSLFYKVF